MRRRVIAGALVCCSVLQFVVECYSVLQCVAACCSVLQCVVLVVSCREESSILREERSMLLCVLQCVVGVLQEHAVCCSVLQGVAACCRLLQTRT